MASKTRLQLNLSARKLPKKKANTFVVILKREGKHLKWLELCRTETVKKSSHPEYPNAIEIEYRFETEGELRFEIYAGDSSDNTLEESKLLAYHESPVASIFLGSFSYSMLLDELPVSTKLLITAREVEENLDMFEFQFGAEDVDRKNYLGLGKSDPFFEIFQDIGDHLVKVFTSEKVVANLSPQWEPASIPVQHLCRSDYEMRLRVKVFDWKSHGDHYFIGQFNTTLAQLLNSSQYPLINPRKTGGNYKNSGTFHINFCHVRKQFSFLKYIQGGLDINLCIAVDFTTSNGSKDFSTCLHFIAPPTEDEIQVFNEYQKAILSMGQILESYDTDKKIPFYGFGGLYEGEVHHCFPLNAQDDPEVDGIESVLQVYENAVATVPFSGPCKFAPVIDEIIRLAKESIAAQEHKYFVLLLLTAGDISDMEETTRLLCEAASLPISLVIAGIGEANFSSMHVLDGDNTRISWNGMDAERDIVQFVPVREYINRSYTALAEKTLEELPRQVTDYYGARNIVPKNPSPEAQLHFNSLRTLSFEEDVVPMAEEVLE